MLGATLSFPDATALIDISVPDSVPSFPIGYSRPAITTIRLREYNIMWLKIIIVVLFVAVLFSLSGALVFLLKDMGSPSRRTLHLLGIRVSLAALLLASIFYGLYTGQLHSSAPWDRGFERPAAIPEPR